MLWFDRMLRGDLGDSIFLREPVGRAIWQHLGPTAGLTVLAEVLALAVAIPSGILAAWKQDSRYDQVFMLLVLLRVSVPSFWTGLNLIAVFAVAWRLLPVAGYAPPSGGMGPWLASLALPAVALAFTQAGLIARIARDSTIVITVLCLNLLGDAVRDVADPAGSGPRSSRRGARIVRGSARWRAAPEAPW